MPPAPKEAHQQLEMAHSAANDAMRAVALQRRRSARESEEDDVFFADTSFRREVDVYFLLSALRWLDESCKLAGNLTKDPALLRALEEYERLLPQARDMRDVHEHVADYIRGDGNLQRPNATPDRRVRVATLGVRMWFGRDSATVF